MKIGLPKALLYYRFGQLWEVFFTELGFRVLVSEDTCKETISEGSKSSVDENCFPLKIFMGHVKWLIGRCDYIFVPRFSRKGRNDEYCIRLWGLPDLVANTFRDAPMLTFNIDSGMPYAEALQFIRLGAVLGKSPAQSLRAYRLGLDAQRAHDLGQKATQDALKAAEGPKILIAAQPYIIHDPYSGGVIRKLIGDNGGIALFSDRCHRQRCREASKSLSDSLYWALNKETIGAVALHKNSMDGIILLTAFPCGSDSLVNELVQRQVKDVPLIQILLDEHTAPAGLETRIESFMDILQQRRTHAPTP